MTPASRYLVLLAILFLPGRLVGQDQETTKPIATTPRVQATVLPPLEVPSRADEVCRGQPRPELACCPCEATECRVPREAVFFFGGQFTQRAMGKTADVFNVTYDDNYIGGLGYQRFLRTWGQFDVGLEVGVAGRFGDAESGEIWGGPVLRHQGITVADRVRATMALTAGFSAVTESQGHERHREITRQGDASFLFYLGPEIILSTTAKPNVELFYRLHHRCGGNGTLGGLSEGYNANCLGLRFKF